ncbi:MAG: leucine--tRNA ligase [Candidatus Delongbacteria bacterium]|nr:leucine--tRNA ligase [Candidatus Delongbacteria bacterium]
MDKYDFIPLEKKWRLFWEKEKLHTTDMTCPDKKKYCLVMFSYPSGDKLHIGHWYNFGPTDSWARFKRLQGYTLFEPMGFDAFGLPAENYAVKTGVHPAKSTASNINYIRQQLKEIGAMYDWDREVDTSRPEYYRWTQWIFLQLYKHGLAYKKKAPVNWCPSCMTVLANEQVKDGCCERCTTAVVHQDLEQWFFKITDYADALLEGLNRIDWPERTKTMQRNWIGKSIGAEIEFPLVEDPQTKIRVFTTRADTLFGVTYVVLSPEHAWVEKLTRAENRPAVMDYQENARQQTEIERLSTEKGKNGVFTGSYAVNPINGETIPIWIADYVLASYGTGAVMAVPAHDQRDYEFALKYALPIRPVIRPVQGEYPQDRAFTDYGTMVNSKDFDGLDSKAGIAKMIERLEEKKCGRGTINYRLRDWLISRQRYWGAPIPIIYCPDCGTLPVPDSDLPVLLPENVDFTPRGQSPLATSPDFVTTTCPKCGKAARREVDTMDTFVCSSWYFLRYLDPSLEDRPFDSDQANAWLPVDQYVGGAEHACMHLLYARFITKVLHDLNYITFDEPFQCLVHQGTITRNGAKMSKSRGNVVNPDDYIQQYGSDTFRCYMMFMGSYEDGGDWDDSGIQGVHRFINRIWRIVHINPDDKLQVDDLQLTRKLHQTIRKVTLDTDKFRFNTAIAAMMEYLNVLYAYLDKQGPSNLTAYIEPLILLIAPFAPHMAEELWQHRGKPASLFTHAAWPTYSDDLATEDCVTMAIQVNGKVRGKLEISIDTPEESVKQAALMEPNVVKYLEGKTPRKIICIPGKLVSIVV